MRFLVATLLVLLVACSGRAPPPVPPPPPDWIELGSVRLEAQVVISPSSPPQSPFLPLGDKPRLLVYEYPQVMQLTLPPDKVARDIAFFDVGGRVLDLYPAAYCAPPSCPPLKSRFLATSVLIAPPGTMSGAALAVHGQMRWWKPSTSQPVEVIGLSDY